MSVLVSIIATSLGIWSIHYTEDDRDLWTAYLILSVAFILRTIETWL